jgi:Skp family chaperone for outer membrane proteins
MLKTLIAVLAFVLFAVAAPLASAQKIAVCNPGKIFDGLDERTAVEDEMKVLNQKIQSEASNRKTEVTDLQKAIQGLLANSTVRKDKEALLQQKAIEFDVWAKMQQQNMANIEKNHIREIYDKITAAVKIVAESKKLDMVISEQSPKLPDDMSNITPAQLGAVLSQNSILFKTDAVDITSDVLTKMNADYKRPKP